MYYSFIYPIGIALSLILSTQTVFSADTDPSLKQKIQKSPLLKKISDLKEKLKSDQAEIPSARLGFDKNLMGVFYIRDAQDSLVAELEKTMPPLMMITLEPGPYFISQSIKKKDQKNKRQNFSAHVVLEKKQTLILHEKDFKEEGESEEPASSFDENDHKNHPFKKEKKSRKKYPWTQNGLHRLAQKDHEDQIDLMPHEPGDENKEVWVPLDLSIYPGIATYPGDAKQTHNAANLSLTYAQTSALSGVALAGGYHATKRAKGLQLSGGANFVYTMKGGQVALGFNHAEYVEGFQIAAANLAGEVQGLQLGVWNHSKKSRQGAQVGLVNLAEEKAGLQIGLINISLKKSGIPIGVLNFVKDGVLRVEYGLDEKQFHRLVATYGTVFSHSSLGYVYHPGSPFAAYGFLAGLGGRIPLWGQKASLLTDLTWRWLRRDKIDLPRSLLWTQLRLAPAWTHDEHFTFFVGPSLNYVDSLVHHFAGLFPQDTSVWGGVQGGIEWTF